MWTRKTTARVTMLGRQVAPEENDIMKKIRKNNTREKEVIQAMKQENGLT